MGEVSVIFDDYNIVTAPNRQHILIVIEMVLTDGDNLIN